MIVSISGILTSASPLSAIVETGGLGYEVNIPVTTAEKLPGPGSQVKLFTHVAYREDAQTMYGFASVEERDFFRLLIENVTGIGPKSALTIMSKLSLPVLESAIRMGDIATLAKCPGIGKKTAERLVVELKSKLGGAGLNAIGVEPGIREKSGGTGNLSDAVAALVALGYKAADADAVARRAFLVLGPKATTEEIIKKALA